MSAPLADHIRESYVGVITTLVEESKARPIVPFLGAGISISAGFPAIRLVVEYLAKVDFVIHFGIYSYRYPSLRAGREGALRLYREHPARFLRDFGWPKLGQIDSDLWEWLERNSNAKGEGGFPLEGEGRKIVYTEDHARKPLPEPAPRSLFDQLSRDICWSGENDDCLDLRDHLRAIAQWSLRRDLLLRESGTAKSALREWRRWKQWYGKGQIDDERKPELLYGDWESLLDRLCEGDFDLIDALFTSFEEGRTPTTAHHFVTFLQSAMDMPLVLTTNFDSLLERAFIDSGTNPKVFDIHRDATLPDSDIVHRRFSILKLHGSAYGLRLGERLRNPLELEAQRDILSYLPHDAVIVVIGFSGGERRIMQLLHAIAQSDQRKDKKRIMWFRGPGPISPQLAQLKFDCKASLTECPISDAAAFLQDWYFRFANGYQSSHSGYEALGGRPLPNKNTHSSLALSVTDVLPMKKNRISLASRRKAEAETATLRKVLRRPVHLFTTVSVSGQERSSSAATLKAAEFVSNLGYEYNPIWIDLESHHTVSGIVAELFENFRRYDPEAPQFTMLDTITLDGNGHPIIDKAVERIREVLARGRYVIVLDSLESFGRPQMMHHGIPSYDIFLRGGNRHGKSKWERTFNHLNTVFSNRVETLRAFLTRLLGWDHTGEHLILKEFRDTYILLTADKPRLRSRVDKNSKADSLKVMQELVNFFRTANPNAPHITSTQVPIEAPKFASTNPCWQIQTKSPLLNLDRRVKERIVAVVSLKQRIGRNDVALFEPGEKKRLPLEILEPLLAILSVFRRPRSMPMIRSITERWILSDKDELYKNVKIPEAHDLIDKALDALAKKDAVLMHEGGRVRMLRDVHEMFYGALTESTHIGSAIRNWRVRELALNYEKRASAVAGAFLAASLHFAAARTCFVDVYLPTHDIQGFYEYLYHRVAVLKQLSLLQALVILPSGSQALTRNTEHEVRSGVLKALASLSRNIIKELDPVNESWPPPNELLDDSKAVQLLLKVLGFSDVVPLTGHSEAAPEWTLDSYIQALRLHALQTVALAIRRNFEFLRGVSTPDTMLSWAQQFLEREVIDVSGEVFVLLKSEHLSETRIMDFVGLSADGAQALEDLQNVFKELRRKSQYAKLEYIGAIETIVDTIMGSEGELAATKESSRERAVRVYLRAKECVAVCEKEIRSGKFRAADSARISRIREQFHLCRAILHMGWDQVGAGLLTKLASCVSKLSETVTDENRLKARRILRADRQAVIETQARREDRLKTRRILRDILEVQAKHLLQQAMHPWHGLAQGWKFEDEAKADDDRLRKRFKLLATAEEKAIKYETLLRETSTSNEMDVRHRSSAYVLRARANYLMGRFSRAHHYLDLANAGGRSENADHVLAKAEIHMAQAELLIYSADRHCARRSAELAARNRERDGARTVVDSPGSNDVKTEEGFELDTGHSEVSKEVSKIRRAEREMLKSNSFMQEIPHQTEWWIRFNLGHAQVCFERLLVDIEKLVRQRRALTEAEYSRNAGALEQSVQKGIKYLRSALDLLPYEKEEWNVISTCEAMQNCPLLLSEKTVYALFIQYYILTTFYWAVLQMWHAAPIDGETSDARARMIEDIVTRVNGGDIGTGEDTWKMWCRALRFGRLGQVDVRQWLRTAIDESRKSSDGSTHARDVSSVVPLRDKILELCKVVCAKGATKDAIQQMWDRRREPPIEAEGSHPDFEEQGEA